MTQQRAEDVKRDAFIRGLRAEVRHVEGRVYVVEVENLGGDGPTFTVLHTKDWFGFLKAYPHPIEPPYTEEEALSTKLIRLLSAEEKDTTSPER